VSPDNVDEVIRRWRDAVLPSVQPQKGFKSVRLFVERQTGKVMSVGLWETEADFQATVAWNQEQIAKFAGLLAATAPPVVEQYELAVEG
jgi:heme-degrading monooxygenase HmoA